LLSSSRGRHTRCLSDWSSDVCSSDLFRMTTTVETPDALAERYRRLDAFLQKLRGDIYPEAPSSVHTSLSRQMFERLCGVYPQAQIGRASCRERAQISVVVGSLGGASS